MFQRKSFNNVADNTDMKINKLKLNGDSMLQSNSSQKLSLHQQLNNSSSVKRTHRQLPNYMKSTASSAVGKEQIQVTCHAKLNSSRTTSAGNSASSVSKLAQNSKRKCGLEEVRIPNVDRNFESSASPKLDVNRHTCSSTMKNAKFPKALEMSRGDTEAEGTSVMKVCSYRCCSLNGHRHDCLPPLKNFLASKRKLMEDQKSMNIKGVSKFRKPVSVKDRKEIITVQPVATTGSNLEIASLMEEVCDDFLVEIYCKPQEEIVAKPISCNERNTEEEEEDGTFDGPIKPEDDVDSAEHKEEDVIHEADKDKAINWDLDSDSDHSFGEIYGTADFLDYVSFEHQYEAEKEKQESLMPEENTSVELEGNSNEEIVKDIEGLIEDNAEDKIENFEVCEIDLEDMDNRSDSTEFYDYLSTFENIFAEEVNLEADVRTDASDEANYAQQSSPSMEENVSEHVNSFDFSSTDFGADSVQDEVPESIQEQLETGENELHSTNKSICDNFVEENNEAEIEEHESLVSSLKELHDEIYEGKNGQELKKENKVKMPKVESSEDSSFDDLSNMKLIITRNEIAEELDDMNEINFRGPDFLPEEPDPEGEKVDLRHQTIYERKNAEDWMIDCALQKAVSKLVSARRRKVSLLVEAFETVVPLPLCEKPLRNMNQDYSRSLQDCN